MTGVGEQQLTGFAVETRQKSRGELGVLCAFEKAIVELTNQHGLVPMVDVLAQRVAKTNGGGTDDLTVAGDVGQRHPSNDSLAAGRQIIKISAALRSDYKKAREQAR